VIRSVIMSFILVAFFLPRSVFADEIITTVRIGGKEYCDVIVDTKDLSLLEEISTGKCRSRMLADFGTVQYNEKDNVYDVVPRIECLETKNINLSGNTTFTPQVSTSFFTNYSLSRSFLNGADRNTNLSLGSGVFVSGTFVYTDFVKTEKKLERNISFLRRDIDSLLSELTIGDIYPATFSSFLSANAVMGIGFSRKYALKPEVRPYRTLSKSIVLTSQSTVEILRDGQVVDRRTLPAGIFTFDNLPFSGMAGKYEIRIKDSFGRETVEEVPYIASPSMLKKGYMDYSFFSGIKRQGGNEYKDLSRYGYFRYGISDFLNAGIHFNDRAIAGSFDYLSRIGQSSFEITTDKAFRFSQNFSNTAFSFGAEFKRDKDSNRHIAGQFGFYLDRIIKSKNPGFVDVRFLYEKKKNGDNGIKRESAGSIRYSNTFSGGLNISCSIDTHSGFSLSGSHQVRFFKRNAIIGLNFTSSQKENRAYGYFQIPLENTEGSTGFTVRTTKNTTTEIQTELKARYYNLYTVEHLHRANGERENITTVLLQGSTACVKQEGLFKCGIGEPVSPGDGFVIDRNLKVEGKERKHTAGILPYRDTVVYFSGNIVGDTVTVAARQGQGVTASGTVTKLVTGRIFYDGTPLRQTEIIINGAPVFTNSDGEFSCIVRGKKKITISYKNFTKEIEIIDTGDEVFSAGDIDFASQEKISESALIYRR
jgi:hypothetical protein